MKILNGAVFAVALMSGVTGAPIFAQAVCFDDPCPPAARPRPASTSARPAPTNESRYRAGFSLANDTRVEIRYQIKWGDGQWKSERLQSGYTTTHSYPMDGGDKAPRPYVRFDRIGGDNAVTEKEYEMDFYKMEPGRTSSAKKYFFKYAADGRRLDIKAR